MKTTSPGRRTPPRISATARAVKKALFYSTLAVSLAGSASALAQSCVQTNTNEVTCTGAFTDSVNNHVPLANQVPDLTIIVGGAAPTSVNPGIGMVGLDSSFGGDVVVVNYADFNTVNADAIYVFGSTSASLETYGDLAVDTAVAGANAIDISAIGDVDVVIGGGAVTTATGVISPVSVYAYSVDGNVYVDMLDTAYVAAIADAGYATAVSASLGKYAGNVDVVNDGAVYAYSATGSAHGVYAASSKYGDATVVNGATGSIDAVVGAGGGYALGVILNAPDFVAASGGQLTLVNDGSISATVEAAGTGEAWGVYAYANDDSDVLIDNNATGTISATVTDGPGDAWAVSAYPAGTGTITVANDGSMVGTTLYGDGEAYGLTTIAFGDGAIDITNSATGVIAAYAGGTGGVGGPAYGVYAVAHGAGDVTMLNDGVITATSDYSDATGVFLYSALGDVTLTNTGAIYAYAYGGPQAVAVRLCANAGATATLNNTGTLVGDVEMDCAGSAVVDNTGDFDGTIGTGAGNDTVTNSGTFTGTISTGAGDDVLTNDGSFTGYIDMGDGNDNLYNNGDITGEVAMGAGDDNVFNYGDITGVIDLGDGDDYLYNGGTISGDIYGGAGDDVVVNEGTINLDGNTIDLGDPGVNGNGFYNNGTIAVNGDSVIDMGPANPNAFCNAGSIDMQDGAANDSLTIYGDFACSGDLFVDADGAAGVADTLYIDGNVDAGSVTTVNVDAMNLVPGIDDLIPIVYVTGTSVAGNFVLGEVNWDEDNSFVTADFSLDADIDATNATPDVFSLDVTVTGLTDPGTIAAALSPAAVNLVNAQITTTRQRFGVLENLPEGGVGLWARVFQDKGTYSPVHSSAFFGLGGNYDWDQRNRGVEAGVDFGLGGVGSLGLMVGRSNADIDLVGPGAASAELEATSWGIYGLFMPGDFYVDASYRWIDFDADFDSIAGAMESSGKAEAFNIEAGYTFTFGSGFQVVPQAQYTRVKVKDVDLLTTTSGMTFRNDGGDSSRARLGVALQQTFGDADSGWRTTPYAAFSLVREMDGEHTFVVNDTLVGVSDVGGTSHLVELGFTARHDRLALYGGLSWQDGGAMDGIFGGHLGERYTFGGATPAPAPAPVAVVQKTCADLDDDGDGVNNCDDKCPGSAAGQALGADGCPLPATPEPEPVMEPKPYRG
jgi:hypothetical protein